MEHEQQTSSLRDFLTILFKHKYKILFIFLAIVIPVTVISFTLLPIYEAKSSLIVKFGREYIYRSEVGDTRPPISFSSLNQEEAINAEIQILTSKDLIEKVINALGMDTIYPDILETPPKNITPLEAALPRFEGNLSVVNIKKSNVIEVSFQHKDPKTAASAVNQLVELYKEKHLQVLSNVKSSFLEKQLAMYQQKLKESENNLEAFKQKYKVFSLDKQRNLLLTQRVDLDTSLKTIQNRIQELKQILSSPGNQILLTSQNVPFYPQSARYKIIDDAKSKLLSLQLKEQELLEKYKEDSEFVVNIRRGIQKEIHVVKEFIREQEKKLIKAELASLESQGATIKHHMNQLDKEIKTLDLTEKDLQMLKREIATNEKNYKTYLSKLEEARISEDMDRQKMANISVIQEAFIPSRPIKPRKVLNIALGIIIGALSGLGLAFFSEHLSQGLSTPESSERRLNLPVLTSISYSTEKGKTKKPLLRWGLSTSATFMLIAGVFLISPYKNTFLSIVKDWRTSGAFHTKTVKLEVQEEIPSLEEEKQKVTIQEGGMPPVPPVQQASLQKDTNNHPWAINISSTTLKENAINLLDKLKKEGYNVYIVKFKHQNKLWYRVRIGFFPTREDAERIGDGLPKEYSLHDYWVIKALRSEVVKHKRK